jgi:hypothetical protein
MYPLPVLSEVRLSSPQVLPATATRAANSRAKGGAARRGAWGTQWAGTNDLKDGISLLIASP